MSVNQPHSTAFHLSDEALLMLEMDGLQHYYYELAEGFAEAIVSLQHIYSIFNANSRMVDNGGTVKTPQHIMADLREYAKGMALVNTRYQVSSASSFHETDAKTRQRYLRLHQQRFEGVYFQVDSAVRLMVTTMWLTLHWADVVMESLLPSCKAFITAEDANWEPTIREEQTLRQYYNGVWPELENDQLPEHREGRVEANVLLAFMRAVGPRMKTLQRELKDIKLARAVSLKDADYKRAVRDAWIECMAYWGEDMPIHDELVIVERAAHHFDPIKCETRDPVRKSSVSVD